MTRLFKSDYGTNSEYSELVLGLQPELLHAYVEPKPTKWATLSVIEKTLLRVVWLSCGFPLIGMAILISGPRGFKFFDIRNLIE
jgi:hypothetical protein